MPFYRSMSAELDGLPRVADSARGLGARVPQDIAPDATGFVEPQSGGMSVAPHSMWNLPHHRRPRRLGRGSTGRDDDRVFAIEGTAIVEPLTTRPDPLAPELHAFVEPAHRMLFGDYTTCLGATRPSWKLAEP